MSLALGRSSDVAARFPFSVGLAVGSLSRAAGGVLEPVRAIGSRILADDGAVAAYGFADTEYARDRATWGAVPTFASPNVVPFACGYAPRMYAAMCAGDHDLMHLHGLWLYPSLAVAKWRRHTGRPTIVSAHGMVDAWSLRNASWKKQIALAIYEQDNLQSAACLHALTAAEAVALRRLNLSNPIAIVPNGVDVPDLSEVTPALLPDGDDRQLLLFLGRIHPKKGVAEMVDAWMLAVQANPSLARQWVLGVAGWGEDAHVKALDRQIAEGGAQAHVRRLGPVFGADKTAMFKRASAFILASHSEGLPMAVLEAWAHGLPAFITAHCALPDGVAAGAAIEISTAPEAMARVLPEHLARADLRAVGAAGLDLVEREYRWDKVLDRMLALYRWTIAGGPRPPSVAFAD